MSLHRMMGRSRTGRPTPRSRTRSYSAKHLPIRLFLEPLEDRTVPSHFGHAFDDINPNNSDLDATDPDGASMGRVNGLATTPESSILYAASEFGGLFKSFDHGITWDHLPGHLPQLTWDVEVDPSNPNRVYATSFYDGRVNPITGIQVSNDGGAAWVHPLTADADPALEGTANDNTPQATYAAANARRTSPAAYGIAIRPDAPNNVAIGTNAGLAISNDSGVTWRIVDPQKGTPAPPPAGTSASNIWDVIWQPGGANGIIDVVGDSGHHRSTDGGTTWTANSLPAAAVGLSSMSIAASPDESYVLYVVGVDNRLYETTNATVAAPAWTPIGATDPIFGGGRIPFVQTNNTTAGFDLWTGGVSLYRVTGTTPGAPAPGGGSRIPLAANPLPAGWNGPFTRSNSGLPPPASQAAHDDVGDIVFDTEVPNDAVPLLMSSDGGVYRNVPVGDVAGATNIPLITVITTTAPHGLNVGDQVRITNVQGNTNANGTFGVIAVTATTFTILVGGNGAYVPGTGHWHLVSQTPRWEQPTRGPHALWLFGMTGVDQPGADAEDIYIGMQDNGSFANTSVGQDDPNNVAADWHNQDCCDVFDLAADADTVLYTFGSVGNPANNRSFRLFLGNFGLTTGGQVNTYPGNVPAGNANAASGGQVTVFQNAESIDNFGDDTYAVLTRDDANFGDGGLHITTNVQANPIVWTELVGNTGNEPWNSAAPAEVQVAMNGGTPTFFVTVGSGGGYTADQLWSYVGTNANANAWTRLDTNIDPGDVGGGVSIFAVDPNNPQRLYASYVDPVTGPRMVFSTNGGVNWQNDTELDFLMTGGGAFTMQMQRGPRDFPDQENSGSPNRGIGTVFQPSLLAYDPENPNIIAAGALDAGVFLSTDGGGSWRLLTDPFGVDDDPTTTLPNGLPLDDNPHISRPRWAHFDHETNNLVDLYIGSQGKGVWRIGVDFTKDIDAFDEKRPNNSIATATVLGSLQKITLRDLSIHIPTDVDFYQYTAQDTGKLIVNMYLDSLGGNLNLRVRDVNGNIIAEGVPTPVAPQLDNEQFVIPVVSQERYFIEVYSPDGHTNCYDLEIENFPAPVPDVVDLDPSDDTGQDDTDDNTFDTAPRIRIQADLSDFAAMGIPILTAAQANAGTTPGAAVQVFINGASQGHATVIAGSDNTLFEFTLASANLNDNFPITPPAGPARGWLNFVTAAVHIFDGQGTPADGRSPLSEPLRLTFDPTAPAAPSTPDLLTTSDSAGCPGSSATDNITNVNTPAFSGTGEMNTIVRIYATPSGGTPVLIGEGRVGSDNTDGVPNNGLGAWEVTVEPLADGTYTITATLEDLAGNISDASAGLEGLTIDTTAPQRPTIDLTDGSDTGRNNTDNITNPDLVVAGGSPAQTAGSLTFRVTADAGTMVVIKDGNTIIDGPFLMPAAEFTYRTIDFAALAGAATIEFDEGEHLLSAESFDTACNSAQSEQLIVEIDKTAPTAPTLAIDPARSDTGVAGDQATLTDRVTRATATGFTGRAEADTIVRLYANGTFDGLTVAVPLDGNQAFPNGQWNQAGILDLNDPLFPYDGLRTMTATAEDRAGNVSAQGSLDIFIDTQGPRVEEVFVTAFPGYDLFDPKPSSDGPTPVITSLTIRLSDLPDRAASFLYDAIHAGVAGQAGHYILRGDHSGHIAIATVVVTNAPAALGSPAEATIELQFDAPLPDDRYTLTLSDTLVDPAGNALDGENNAREPQEVPSFPSGDGQVGGDFVARFTVDTRPEIGTYSNGAAYLDINGNGSFDPTGEDNDFTNRDITFAFGLHSDQLFAGNFAPALAASASGFDKLAAYGRSNGTTGPFRFLIDFDSDGVVDLNVTSGVQGSGMTPIAGNFNAAHPGDEIGLFDGSRWFLDSNANYILGDAGDTTLLGNLRNAPIVGDFDGDGFDDLATYKLGLFSFDLAADGLDANTDVTINFSFFGAFETSVAADMNKDGIDDIGLFIPERNGVPPGESGEWFFLISTGAPVAGTVSTLNHPFKPVPFGNDLYFQYGDQLAKPIVGNFDPPVTSVPTGTGPTIQGPASVAPGVLYPLTLSRGATSGVQSWTVNWGDGTIETLAGSATAATHRYDVAASIYTIQASLQANGVEVRAGNTLQVAVNHDSVHERFVNQAYLDLLRRSADASGLAYWAGLLDRGLPRAALVGAIQHSDEYRTREVQDLYVGLLHRPADAGGLQYFLGQLRAGGTLAQVRAQLVGSAEYYQGRGRGNDAGLVEALYEDALGRAADTGGKAYFQQLLRGGASPGDVAAALFTSREAHGRVAQGLYAQVLGRAADVGGLQFLTDLLDHGWQEEDARALLTASEEYFARL